MTFFVVLSKCRQLLSHYRCNVVDKDCGCNTVNVPCCKWSGSLTNNDKSEVTSAEKKN